jgi:hypothetical protein
LNLTSPKPIESSIYYWWAGTKILFRIRFRSQKNIKNVDGTIKWVNPLPKELITQQMLEIERLGCA